MLKGNVILFKTKDAASYKTVSDYLKKHDYTRVIRGVYSTNKNTVNSIISVMDMLKEEAQLNKSDLIVFKLLRVEEVTDLGQIFDRD